MRKLIFVLFFLLAVSIRCYAEDTPHYQVVSEFVRELVETKNYQDVAKADFDSARKENSQAVMMAIIRNGTRIKLKLAATIGRLQQMQLSHPFETLLPTLIEFYNRKIELYDDMVTTAKTFADGPKPGVDYGKLSSHMPEVTAQVEYVDESIFKMTPLVFALIISQKPDSQNHLSHLSITRKQAQQLLTSLQEGFGRSMNAKEQDWTVSSASVLRTYLRDKGYKYADDPWQ
ncbi:hypothetical protein [Paraburkholderia lacunae]|uniref:Uncharacterized protein n=1 Tax=Paraburkholderia lacunae TaxID=2211104 RepID=A0A370NG66_9BURK|nr:hypothetical protein [Paraburkholderia lacunae]RDK04601.1 hypothetical protein DLM46_01655 [Paraburkholderia lacunae]